MNSAYYIFKRPDLIAKGEPFLECVFRESQGRVHYTPNLAQEINLSRIQRQLIADKGSFDGGTRLHTAWRAHLKGSRQRARDVSLKATNGDSADTEHGVIVFVRHTTNNAALTERRINVDRVSTDGHIGPRACVRWRRSLKSKGLGSIQQRTFGQHQAGMSFNADSYSRCFRYLDCFLIGGDSDPQMPPRGFLLDCRTYHKAVYLSSQLDRILGLNKASQVSSGTSDSTSCPVGVCRIDWVAQLTQTKQGGCLYEQPCSQNYAGERKLGRLKVNLCWLKQQQGDDNRGVETKSLPPHPIWQKPGIGPMAVRKSSPFKGSCREEGEPIPMKHVGSIRTLPAEGKGHSYGNRGYG